MSGDDLAKALTSGGATWLVLSLAAVLPILWAFVLVLHFARPYVVRFLGTLTLRFGADVWWLSYVLFRDGLMIVTLALSVVFLMPNLYIGLGLPITAPLAAVGLFWALVIKLTGDADDDPRRFQLVSVVLVVSSVLYIVPQIYGLEAADQTDAWKAVGLDWLPGALTASDGGSPAVVNTLAWPIEWIGLVLFGLTGAYLFTRFLLGLGREDVAEAPTEMAAAKTA
ncbi:MAG TPA: hypothetical protein VEY67_01275 [Candidatus Dormibacteraeota bacterium]|nr:hypothetical protein [Candidatus Dormibacteraeota bacterium]